MPSKSIVLTQHNVASCKRTCLLASCAARKWHHCINPVRAIVSLYVTDLHFAVHDEPCPSQYTGVQPQVKVRKLLDQVNTTG